MDNGVPRGRRHTPTVDRPSRTSTGWAITIDLALLSLFAAQHSLMARRSVKVWLSQRMPAALERTTYVWATNVLPRTPALLLADPWGGEIWRVHGAAAFALWALCAFGWALAIASTFAVDHFELIGLRQAGWMRPRTGADDGLQVGGLHAFVRHPLMTGLLLAFWATPHMGASHLLFALASTGYIAIGIHFEERDLRAHSAGHTTSTPPACRRWSPASACRHDDGEHLARKPVPVDFANERSAGSVISHLGIEFTDVGADHLTARMPVDARTLQPAGVLHGGASVVLAETLASWAATSWSTSNAPTASVWRSMRTTSAR